MKRHIVNCIAGYVVCLIFSQFVSGEQSQDIKIENQHYLCVLNVGSMPGDKNGIMWSRLFNKKTNTDYLYPAANKALFMILGENLMLDSTDFVVEDVNFNNYGQESELRISLSRSSENLYVTLGIRTDSTDKMQWSLDVKNNSGTTKKLMPIFPLMAPIRIGNNLSANKYFYPWRTGIVGDIDCYLKNEYGNFAWMQIMSVFDESSNSGLFTYPVDSSGGFKGLLFKKVYNGITPTVDQSERISPEENPYIGGAPGSRQQVDVLASVTEGIGFTYYYPMTEIAAGATYIVPETVIGVHQGGWKYALTDYRNWAHTWYSHVNTPAWFMNCFNFQPAWPVYYHSKSLSKYICSENMCDPNPVHIFQWAQWWQYTKKPELPNALGLEKFQAGDFYYNLDRGGLTAFKNEIKVVQAKGSRMTVYINDKMCYHETDTGQAYGQQWAQMDLPGRYCTWGGANEYWIECLYEPNAWPAYMAQTCARVIRDTGMDGIYLDEMPVMWPCYNSAHTHYRQTHLPFSVERMRDYIIMSRNAIRSENPEGILMTEHAGSDYFSQFIDGSWVQTFYSAFPFAARYYDENSANYFRFCFPEFKLAEWGQWSPSDDGPHRSFFNGTGIDLGGGDLTKGGNLDYLHKTGQTLRENGDAFAAKTLEPLVDTKVKGVLSNKFSVPEKTVYTIYNKSDKAQNGEIIEVNRRTNYHWVELLYDNEINVRKGAVKTRDVLSIAVESNDVVCVAQLPRIIKARRQGKTISIGLKREIPHTKLLVFANTDIVSKAATINIHNGKGSLDMSILPSEKGKLILKLMDGDTLIDEVVMEIKQ